MYDFSRPLDLLYGLTALACCLVGFPGNCFAARHFYLKKRDGAQLNYLLISLNDGLVCLIVCPTAVSFLSHRDEGLLGYSPVCYTWATLYFVTMRTAVFLTMVLSINRTLSLVFPFRPPSKRAPLVAFSVFVTFLAAQLLVTQWWGFRAQYSTYLVGCIWSGNHSDTTLRSKAIYLEVSMILTYVLPVLFVTVGCVISTSVLLSSSGAAGDVTLRRKHRANRTIVIFTVIYLVFNIPHTVSVILQTVGVHSDWRVNLLQFDYSNPPYLFYFKNYVTVISTTLNSAINPLVYLWRFSDYGNRLSYYGNRLSYYGNRLRASRQRLSQILSRTVSSNRNNT